MLLWINPRRHFHFGYEAITLYGLTFQKYSPMKMLCNFSPALSGNRVVRTPESITVILHSTTYLLTVLRRREASHSRLMQNRFA